MIKKIIKIILNSRLFLTTTTKTSNSFYSESCFTIFF